MRRRAFRVWPLAVSMGLLAACGQGAEFTADEGDVQTLCTMNAQLEQQPPEAGGDRAEELAEMAEIAPVAIREDVETLRDHHDEQYVEGDPTTDSYDQMSPDVRAAIDRYDAYVAEQCD